MFNRSFFFSINLIFLSLLFLSACGGGGGGSTSVPTANFVADKTSSIPFEVIELKKENSSQNIASLKDIKIKYDSEVLSSIYSDEEQVIKFSTPLFEKTGNYNFQVVNENNDILSDFSLSVTVLTDENDFFKKQEYLNSLRDQDLVAIEKYESVINEYLAYFMFLERFDQQYKKSNRLSNLPVTPLTSEEITTILLLASDSDQILLPDIVYLRNYVNFIGSATTLASRDTNNKEILASRFTPFLDRVESAVDISDCVNLIVDCSSDEVFNQRSFELISVMAIPARIATGIALGATAGAVAGTTAFGIGAIPGALIGGAIGGVAAGIEGNLLFRTQKSSYNISRNANTEIFSENESYSFSNSTEAVDNANEFISQQEKFELSSLDINNVFSNNSGFVFSDEDKNNLADNLRNPLDNHDEYVNSLASDLDQNSEAYTDLDNVDDNVDDNVGTGCNNPGFVEAVNDFYPSGNVSCEYFEAWINAIASCNENDTQCILAADEQYPLAFTEFDVNADFTEFDNLTDPDNFSNMEEEEEEMLKNCRGGYQEYDAGTEKLCISDVLITGFNGNCGAGFYNANSRNWLNSGSEPNICLWYSRDFIKSGQCIENYEIAEVFSGKQTCRFDQLPVSQIGIYKIDERNNEITLSR